MPENNTEPVESQFDWILRKMGYKDRKHFYRDLIFDIILLVLISVFAQEALNRWELCPMPTESLLDNFTNNFSFPD